MTLTEFVGGNNEDARIRCISKPLDQAGAGALPLRAARGQYPCRAYGKAG